jgi:hypothetical protein
MLTKNCLGYILGDFFPTHIITLWRIPFTYALKPANPKI